MPYYGNFERILFTGNHAQALALAARTRGIPAYVVMPSISAPSKIAATKGYGAEVTLCGPLLHEREAAVEEVIRRTGAIFIPPFDHPDIILGQGTMALEFEQQVEELLSGKGRLGAIITPCGGGGMLSGVATAMIGTRTQVFGAEPSFQGADDCRRGLLQNKRITTVKTLTIADGLRTSVGEIPWSIISDPTKVHGVFSVSEEEIKRALKLVIERMKILIEPSAAVPVAVVLFNEEFRRLVQKEVDKVGGDGVWNVGVVLSGGNTTLEALCELSAWS
jgi:threonine dehydratase